MTQPARTPMPSPFPAAFLWREIMLHLRGRSAALVLGLMLYGLVAVSILLRNPAEHMVEIVGAFFGDTDQPAKLFLYIWVDLAMNKLIGICGPIFAAGVITSERAKGTLEVLASKPLSLPAYFTAKALAAMAAFGVLYTGVSLLGLLWFPLAAPHFPPAAYVLLVSNHLFAALFAVALSCTLSVFFRKKLSAMLASIFLLFVLLSFALAGFYIPSLMPLMWINPMSYGVILFAHIDGPTFWQWCYPILALILFSAGVLALGAWRTSRLEI